MRHILFSALMIILAACQSTAASPVPAPLEVVQSSPTPKVVSLSTEIPLSSLPAPQFQLVGALGGAMKALFVQDEYAYVGVGLQLLILDVANPASPRPVASLLLPQSPADIYVHGDIAYIAQAGGVSMINIADPTSPALIGAYTLPGAATGVVGVADADFIYVAYHQGFDNNGRTLGGGLNILDISTPTNPVAVGNYQSPETIYDLAVASTGGRLYAYLAEAGECRRADSSWVDFICQGRIRILDLSEPGRPVETAAHKTEFSARKITIKDDRAYIAECELGQNCQGLVLDVSDPAQPRETGSFQPVATDPTAIIAYDPAGPITVGAVKAAGNYIYATDDIRRGLAVIDAANPAMPQEIGFVAVEPPGKIWGLHPPYLYLGDEWYGLHSVDISTPTTPVITAFYAPPLGQRVLAVEGGLAYVTTPQGWQIIDLSAPATPREVASYQTAAPGISLLGATVQGERFYTAAYEDGWQVVNWANPAAPTEQGFVALPNGPPPLVADTFAYFGLADGMQIFDLSNPVSPLKLGFYPAPGFNPKVVAVGYGLALVMVDRLHLVDVSNPAAPFQVGVYEGLQSIDAAALAPGPAGQLYAYVYSPAGRLDVVELSNPAAPVRLGSYNLSQGDWLPDSKMVVAGQYAYLSGPSSVAMVDVSDPAAPFEAGVYQAEGGVRVVSAASGAVYAYVLDFNGNLRIVDISNPTLPQEIGLYDTPQSIVGITAGETMLYLSLEAEPAGGAILRLDLSNPAAPQEAGRYESGLSGGWLMAAGDYLYLQAGRQMVRAVDVSNPANLVEAGSVLLAPPGISIEQLFAAGERLFLVLQLPGNQNLESTWGLQVIDVSTTVPTLIGTFEPQLPALHRLLAAGDNYLYFLDRRGQLRLLDMSNPASPQDIGAVLTFDPAGYVQDGDILGDALYLGLGDLGLAIFKRL